MGTGCAAASARTEHETTVRPRLGVVLRHRRAANMRRQWCGTLGGVCGMQQGGSPVTLETADGVLDCVSCCMGFQLLGKLPTQPGQVVVLLGHLTAAQYSQ